MGITKDCKHGLPRDSDCEFCAEDSALSPAEPKVPDEVWLYRRTDGTWDLSFDPPLKRHELRMVRMVPAAALEQARAELATVKRDLRSTEANRDYWRLEAGNARGNASETIWKLRAALVACVKVLRDAAREYEARCHGPDMLAAIAQADEALR